MTKIDISGWGRFKVGELFEFERGKEAAPKKNEEGTCPLIIESNKNNGFDRKVKPTKVFKGNAITISVNAATCVFYQDYDFCASVNILIIRNDFINKYSGLFVATILKNVNQRFTYSNKISAEKLKTLTIPLPQTSTGEPDWEYMESFMKEREVWADKRIKELKEIMNYKPTPIDISGWGRFKVGELFEIKHGTRIKQADRIEGNNIFITAGKENLGVVGKIGNKIELWHNPITIDMFGNSFAHDHDCCGDDNVYAFINDSISDLCKLFIATIINQATSNKYSYANQFRNNHAQALTIPLPQTPQGTPDWEYMENFMKEREIWADKRIAALKEMKLYTESNSDINEN